MSPRHPRSSSNRFRRGLSAWLFLLEQRVRDRVPPIARDLRLDRQTEKPIGQLVGDRKRDAGSRKVGMSMDAAWIMDAGFDAMAAREHQTDPVAVRHRNRELVIDRALIIRRQPGGMTCKLRAIPGGKQPPLVVV